MLLLTYVHGWGIGQQAPSLSPPPLPPSPPPPLTPPPFLPHPLVPHPASFCLLEKEVNSSKVLITVQNNVHVTR